MPQANINGLNLEYETFGNPADPGMLLIMGLGSQLIQWPVTLCQQLADSGHFVIRYDHRDIGLSSRMDHLMVPDVRWAFLRHRLGLKPNIPYSLLDLAQDALGLLDFLHIKQAHLVGVSMGGMIAQLLAIHFPARVLSLTSVMSTTGNPKLPKATPAAQVALAAPVKRRRTGGHDGEPGIEDLVDQSVAGWKAISSPGFPPNEQTLRAQCEAVIRRGHHGPGIARHLLACLCTTDRRKQLQQLALPTLVIHGTADPLIPLACGEDTAANIRGAELLTIEGMGHDLPEAILTQLADKICTLARRAPSHQPLISGGGVQGVCINQKTSNPPKWP